MPEEQGDGEGEAGRMVEIRKTLLSKARALRESAAVSAHPGAAELRRVAARRCAAAAAELVRAEQEECTADLRERGVY